MNTILTLLMYFGLASLALFVIGLIIQATRRPKKTEHKTPTKSEQHGGTDPDAPAANQQSS
ncbi:hypothetical protein [Pelagicoccus sp. SDUM812002]|uniref:hypothetical protein n=1 Tax=Pelagicoccus sp. SDUM812002 TaxID=3041266 RepID=UPI00280D7FA9|nr:hypothetical protein [Pelagicoccus sp. SDUM812002]MDQ8187617.1 hypothetical protein [Pelagicoccus sp. SDUM812002]